MCRLTFEGDSSMPTQLGFVIMTKSFVGERDELLDGMVKMSDAVCKVQWRMS